MLENSSNVDVIGNEVLVKIFRDKYELSEKQVEVLHFVLCGMNRTQVAECLSISVDAVKFHLKEIFQKLDAHDMRAVIGRLFKDRLDERQ